ncbi:DEAD/DEAH box helicase (plasmid) [Sphingomonas sp. NY01]|uniref:DEAD/DEAH box helicase n=1 Tax=Sphingomonas sp. NY01 TaxID=2968057 RepID=UPI00315DEB37
MPEITGLSAEQEAIVGLPLGPIAVTACAGSGKTRTAVSRLAAMRRLHVNERSLVVLLSFSNVAVETFRNEYAAAVRLQGSSSRRDRAVEIDTMDGFITTNVLRPHGHRVMGCDCTPFLVEGREPFLKSFTVFDGTRSHSTASLSMSLQGGAFVHTVGRQAQVIDSWRAEAAVAKLGAVGAYTHASARYWVWRTLKNQPSLLDVLARRYPHILVDEAQDIGPEHQAILELLIQHGSKVSLIGDPNQAIYEFAQADGGFLSGYGARTGVSDHQLSVNYRSVPSILEVANHLTGRADTANRQPQVGRHGAFYIPYDSKDRGPALSTFQSLLERAGIDVQRGVVLCRSSDLAGEWGGEQDGQGVGVVRCFANAAISRDQLGKLPRAFSEACAGVIGLLAPEHGGLTSQLARGTGQDVVGLRRAIWSFVRDAKTGLPSSALVADTAWHPLLCARVRALLLQLEGDYGLKLGENLGNKLAKKALENRPLIEIPDLAEVGVTAFPASTVHKVKGASLDAVLYVAKKRHVRALLDGTGSEDGRIGYVALTRARDLFVLAVPKACLAEFEADLQAIGLKKAG